MCKIETLFHKYNICTTQQQPINSTMSSFGLTLEQRIAIEEEEVVVPIVAPRQKSTITKYNDSAALQLGKGQDVVKVGIDNEQNHWCALFDGHGRSQCISAIDEMPIDSMMKTSDTPISLIHDRLQQMGRRIGYESGSTAITAKMFDDHVLCESVGDSDILVFVNDKLVWRNEHHNHANPKEMERLNGKVTTKLDWCPKIVGPNRLMMTPSKRLVFPTNEGPVQLVPSMNLGHRNICNYTQEIHRINFASSDKVRVVCCSDGVMDMIYDKNRDFETVHETMSDDIRGLMTMTAVEIVQQSHQRWTNEWDCLADYRCPDTCAVSKSRFSSSDYDDCCVGVLQNYAFDHAM